MCPSSVTLALSGDAVPTDTPNEYVVPERGTVTFTCNSSDVPPGWNVDFKKLGSSSGFASTDTLLSGILENVSSSDIGSFPNPTSFTVHNIPTESNGSYVECSAQGRVNSTAIIFVVGENLYLFIVCLQKAVLWQHNTLCCHGNMSV